MMIQRYTAGERANHWIVATCFVLAALSGLAMFHPSFFFFSNLLGGGAWTRILHPFIGLVMFAFFVISVIWFWEHNVINDADRRWMQSVREFAMNRETRMPEIGKYNAVQKYLFWVMVLTMCLLLVTGFMMWRQFISVPIWLNRLAVVIHALSAFVLILGIIVHVYAAIWVKGTLRGMTRGSVSEAWARHHHRLWYREVTGK